MAEPVAELVGVIREYGTTEKTRVLHGVDLTIRHGEFVAILGPSGSGKSTLLNLIGALDRPSAGTVSISGERLDQLSDSGLAELRRKHLGFIFQFHYLLPNFTALENVMMPSLIVGDDGQPVPRREAVALLERVGLQHRIRNRATDLSGGQQQRVAIARALARKKTLILADEPTGNLDTQTGEEVFHLMREFNKTDGTTFVIVTHDLRIADACDRVVEVVDGRIVRDHAVTR